MSKRKVKRKPAARADSSVRWNPRGTVTLWLVFAAGIGLAAACWDKIRLPFSNPWQVVGLLTYARFNPNSNYPRFACLLLAPIALLLLLYLAGPKRFKHLVFRADSGAGFQADAVPRPRRNIIIAALVLMLLSVILALNYPTELAWGTLDTCHEGVPLGTSVSYEHGQVPCRDFMVTHGMIEDPLKCVIAFRLFGRSIGAVRAVESMLKVLEFLLLAATLLLVLRGSLRWSALTLLILAPMLFWRVPTASSATEMLVCRLVLRDITVLAFLVAVLYLQRTLADPTERRWQLFVTAFLSALLPLVGLLYSVDRGSILILAYAVLATLLYTAYLRGHRSGRLFLLASVLGALSGVGLLYVFTRGGLIDYLRHAVLIQPRCFALAAGYEYTLRESLLVIVPVLITGEAYWLAVRLLGLHASHGGRWREALTQFADRYFSETSLLVCSVFVFSGALLRCDWPHVAVGAFFPLVLFLLIAFRHYVSPALSRSPRAQRTADFALGSIVVVCAAYAVWRICALGLMSENFPIGKRDADFVPINHVKTIQFLRENLREGQTFFTMTGEGTWYYFLDQPCPCKFVDIYFASPVFYQREMIRDLAARNVEFIILTNTKWTNDLDGIATELRLPLVSSFIRANYEPFAYMDGNLIWARKDQLSVLSDR